MQRVFHILACALLLGVFWALAGLAAAAPQPGCLECHQAPAQAAERAKLLGPHAQLECGDCHQGVAEYPHERPSLVPCLSCHTPHSEAQIADVHAGVSCQACHFAGLTPLRAKPGGPVSARPPAGKESTLYVHRLVDAPHSASCGRCHHPGNQLGAAAAVLPAKGLLCLACHTATLTLPDWPSRLALAVLVLGLLAALGFWFSGTRGGALVLPGGKGQAAHQAAGVGVRTRLGRGLAALVLDGLLQRRLWRFSPGRGLIHALIFWPLLLRLLWALAALALNHWWPQGALSQALLHKNQPATALFFDLTGLIMLAGVAAAALRRLYAPPPAAPGLPRPDWPALALLGGAVLMGFVLEAARLAMTGWPAGGGWAPAGWALSRLFSPGPALQEAYAWLWYAHVVLYAGFVAYLPFSRMFHILTAPLVLALRGAQGQPALSGSWNGPAPADKVRR
ncbi:MAG: hypothetical protein C4525_10240 [Desulfarculus sp.]|nr:MAG: hypothetical protein C4525_10240 [Desulfarculus sp.]